MPYALPLSLQMSDRQVERFMKGTPARAKRFSKPIAKKGLPQPDRRAGPVKYVDPVKFMSDRAAGKL